MNKKEIEEFKGKMNAMLDLLYSHLHYIKVVSNFLPKEHKDTTKEHSESLIEGVEFVKKLTNEFIANLESNEPSSKEIIERILSELRATCLSCNKSYKFTELKMNPYFKEISCLNPNCKENKFKLWLKKEGDKN